MAVYWCTEALPLAITALLPVCLFPTLGILPSQKVCPQYFLETNFLFLSGLVMASSIEEWGLHRRVALKVLTIVGVKPAWWGNTLRACLKKKVLSGSSHSVSKVFLFMVVCLLIVTGSFWEWWWPHPSCPCGSATLPQQPWCSRLLTPSWRVCLGTWRLWSRSARPLRTLRTVEQMIASFCSQLNNVRSGQIFLTLQQCPTWRSMILLISPCGLW